MTLSHAPAALRGMQAESVHVAVTSPPYYGLRSYKIAPVTWPDGWTGNLGMEPDVDQYIAHLVSVFAELRRVLRSDGMLWVNIADSYAGSNSHGSPEETTSAKQRSNGGTAVAMGRPGSGRADGIVDGRSQRNRDGVPLSPGLKPLDLCGIPERFALAMQRDGWWWRDRIAWCKTSPMPESVSGTRWERCRHKQASGRVARHGILRGNGHVDESNVASRPDGAQWHPCPGCDKCRDTGGYVLRRGSWRTTRAWEYVLMFTKSADYFAVQEQVREPLIQPPHPPGNRAGLTGDHMRNDFGTERMTQTWGLVAGRNPRSWWVLGPEPCNWDFCMACQFFAPKGFGGKNCPSCGAKENVDHYAMFPTDLPKRCIQASTSDAGCCPTCGAQWAPVVERKASTMNIRIRNAKKGALMVGAEASEEEKVGYGQEQPGEARILSYRPTCACPPHEAIPATVLDPFSGAGTTGLAALRLGRSYVGIELSEGYVALQRRRLEADAPLGFQEI